MIRDPREDAGLLALVQRYVTPERRYLKLGGGLLHPRGPEGDHARFLRDLREDADVVTADEIGTLLEGGWRERRTATWLVAVSRRTAFRERIGELLLASEVCCVGLAYCMTLAGFGTARDADLLAAYLERYLRRPDLAHDQSVAMGALLVVDEKLPGDRAAAFLEPGGLWPRWLRDAPHMRLDTDPAGYANLVRALCALVDDCARTR
ncbi:DUF6000 family protein [Streptomyces sp. NPDC090106]|uniref:DUF6000 family protein n=1 Tax=Streptomyces sp. NPDC090106 TaxID=3365946 RepID=UPI00382F358C